MLALRALTFFLMEYMGNDDAGATATAHAAFAYTTPAPKTTTLFNNTRSFYLHSTCICSNSIFAATFPAATTLTATAPKTTAHGLDLKLKINNYFYFLFAK